MMGSMGRMHGERMVTMPAIKAKAINKIIGGVVIINLGFGE